MGIHVLKIEDMMGVHANQMVMGGVTRNMAKFELDRLFGRALTDARFFRQLRDKPHQAVAQFSLTDLEARAVIDIAPGAATIEDLAIQLDRWMTQEDRSLQEPCPETQFIGFNSAAQNFEIADDVLLSMVREGRIRLSKQDVSQVAIQVMSREYA
jgi:hypothetical protein